MKSRALVVTLFAAAALGNLNGLALYPFLPSIAEDFDTSISVIGQAMTLALIGGALTGLVAGPLSDHYGHRRFVVLGALLLSISSAGTALASSYETLLLVRFPGGIAGGIMMGIGASIATTRLAEDERRSALGWMVSGAALGAVIGPPLMTTLAGVGTWRTGFGFLAVAPILLIAGCFRVIGPDPSRPAARFRLIQTIADYRYVLLDRRSALLMAATVFWGMPTIAGSAYLGAHLVQSHGFSLSGVGLAFMWGASWMMVGSRVGIKLLTYFDLYPLIIIASLMLMLTTFVLFWIPTGFPWILLFVMLWPLNFGMGSPLLTSAISEAARGGQGTAMMARQFCWTMGGASGVAIGGVLIAVGGYTLFGFAAGLCAFAVATLVFMATRPAPTMVRTASEFTPGA